MVCKEPAAGKLLPQAVLPVLGCLRCTSNLYLLAFSFQQLLLLRPFFMRLKTPFVPRIGVMAFLHEQPQGPDPCPGRAAVAAGGGWEPPVRFKDQKRSVCIRTPSRYIHRYSANEPIACVTPWQPGHCHREGGAKRIHFAQAAYKVGKRVHSRRWEGRYIRQ